MLCRKQNILFYCDCPDDKSGRSPVTTFRKAESRGLMPRCTWKRSVRPPIGGSWEEDASSSGTRRLRALVWKFPCKLRKRGGGVRWERTGAGLRDKGYTQKRLKESGWIFKFFFFHFADNNIENYRLVAAGAFSCPERRNLKVSEIKWPACAQSQRCLFSLSEVIQCVQTALEQPHRFCEVELELEIIFKVLFHYLFKCSSFFFVYICI